MKTEKQIKLQQDLQDALRNCAINPEFNLEEVKKVFDLLLERFGLDVAFAMANKEYKYQLNYLVCCTRTNHVILPPDNVALSVKEYETVVDYYRKNPIYERELTVEKNGCTGWMLQCAIMREGEYYGTVGFGCAGAHTWTEEEKQMIVTMSRMMLVFLGLNRLRDRRDRLEIEEKKLIHANTLELFHVDLTSGLCHALRVMPAMKTQFKEWDRFETIFEAHVLAYVNAAYTERLRKTMSLEYLRQTLRPQNPLITVEYPVETENRFRWIRGTAELAECGEDNKPCTALVYFDDITEEAQRAAYLKHAKNADQEKYTLIAGVDPETEQYAVYVNNVKTPKQTTLFEQIGSYPALVDAMADHVVDPMYAARFRELFALDQLREHFSTSREMIALEYPHVAGKGARWMRLEAARSGFDSGNGKFVLYFTDITAQKKKEIAFHEISRSLEKEHEHVLQVEQQAMIDPLTGAYNRTGFEFIVRQYREKKLPMGFVMIDIDQFKNLNDTYGHEFGDEVLRLIAGRLMASFRDEDKVFRLGGDEFALLLYGCHADAWRSLQMKFSNLHHYLRETVRKDVTVTLSAGFSQSDTGYCDEMPRLADEALYHTKNTGRAGLSQINDAHEIVFSWHDEDLSDRRGAMQKSIVICNWRVEIRMDGSGQSRLFLDEASHIMMEIPNKLTPEECFAFWNSRLVPRDQEMLEEVVAKLKTLGQAECIYHWNHPSKGEISIRVVGQLRESGVVVDAFGYMRELQPSDIVLSYDDGRFLMQALNLMNFCSYYFNLQSGAYYIIKGHENEAGVKERHTDIAKTFRTFAETVVHPKFRQKVLEFADLDTLSERLQGKAMIDCDYLTDTPLGWCRTSILPVKWDMNGRVTHAISMSASIDAAKQAELDKEKVVREAMQLQLRVGEIVSKSTIVQTGIIEKSTGLVKIWPNALFTENSISCSFEEMRAYGRSHVYPKDAAYFDTNFTLAHILSELEQNGSVKLSARCVNDDGKLVTIFYHFAVIDAERILMVIEDVSDLIPQGIEWMHQFEILEEVRESIAIFDYDTYDIVYMNKQARDGLGMNLETLRTKKCYELFSDTGSPCDFCDKMILDEGASGFMCREIRGTGKQYFIHGCAMTINGKKYRTEQAVPASDIDASIDRRIERLINGSREEK